MLLRLYRLTDKFGIVILKSLAALSQLLAEGAQVILGSARRGHRSGVFGVLAVLASVILGALMLVTGLIGALLSGVFRLTRGTTRVAASVAARTGSAATGGIDGAMARRAAKSELQTQIAEDPLRKQNRLLGLVVIVMLAALIGVVIWATGPNRNTPQIPLTVADGGAPLIAPTGEVQPQPTNSSGGGLGVPTPIATITPLPDVLQARGSLAFTVRQNGQNDLWAIPVGSRTPIRITNDAADERDPAWSPDALRLAYASNKDGNWEIYLYDLLANQTTRMTFNREFDANPAWSPDSNWLVYETYQGGTLDVYVLPVTDANASLEPITLDASADFSPAWSPTGRDIAFVSWRDGRQDIYVVSLDDVSVVRNVTDTVERHEDYPAWSPDGRRLAYSALDGGIEKVFVRSLDSLDAPPEVIGAGRAPSWSPDGRAIVAAVDTIDATHLTVYPYEGAGVPQIISVPPRATSPTWSALPLPASLVSAGGLPLQASALYVEQETAFPSGLYPLGPLVNGVDAPRPQLSDRVNDSFNALREGVLAASGRDYLARLSDAFWDLNQRPQPGEEVRNWHYTGRAFSIDRNSALVGFPALIEVAREERGIETQWRVYLRVSDDAQSGQLGEPLRQMPWDINSRFEGDIEAYDGGGRLRTEMPQGYYVDLTMLAEDYGWRSLPAGSDWRLNFNAMNYWLFYKPDGLVWLDAMLEIWTRDQLGAFAPTPTPSPSETQEQPEA